MNILQPEQYIRQKRNQFVRKGSEENNVNNCPHNTGPGNIGGYKLNRVRCVQTVTCRPRITPSWYQTRGTFRTNVICCRGIVCQIIALDKFVIRKLTCRAFTNDLLTEEAFDRIDTLFCGIDNNPSFSCNNKLQITDALLLPAAR